MKTLIGLLLVLGGVALGLYVGLWLMLVGGIVEIVRSIQADHLDGLRLALGIVRVIFANAVGVICGVVLIAPGAALMKD